MFRFARACESCYWAEDMVTVLVKDAIVAPNEIGGVDIQRQIDPRDHRDGAIFTPLHTLH